ncbi:MAG: class I SAM-dependent methyltransferase [Sphingomonadales bacterium]|nr:class I SAM-dependent methyltransferase [Sphingomonadales bacterium]NCO48760.1 class I SAM-dependent methyltransferase [Sphingomonadales bacterium]NCO99905.1 class I SAM-dependent methyltransferase [Sphingomonadales bacterium]NCP27393.1 class I SAM-dependent methyltransferase [Sphingomonadales bacterium]NCP43149.1 class I SAM-dependent methyltransferase [Sphingomonadales bacterium]
MKKLLMASAALAMLGGAVPAAANHHEKDGVAMTDASMQTVLNAETRADDKARDGYRHPAQTLNFFGVKPGQTVVEYGPGGGWYTRILVPYLADNGQYVAINADSSASSFSDRAREARTKSWPENFPMTAAKWTGVDAKKIMAFESDELPDDMKGKVDRILIFRSLHGMMNGNSADSELRALRDMLADDGMVGVVQHRAKPDASYAMSNGSKGYLKQASVVALFELNGFELVKKSEINANPKDMADYPGGVWTLPPVLGSGDTDKAKYEAIGESDRMTLLFKKRP